ncbi:MAG: exosortase/archaeosortase family protein [Desulfuromonadales bacterium]|nr:exosortase/archaeosortase family protein [Desulfuromonadales bacterium]
MTEKFSFLCLASVLFVGTFVFLFWETMHGMVVVWDQDANYSHGFIIPFVSGYLVWQKWGTVTSKSARTSVLGLILMVFGLFSFLAGQVADEDFTMRVSMIIVFGGGLLFAFGREIFKEILFPYGYLFFMVPLPYVLYDNIAFPLKLLISKYSVLVMKAMSIPVLREGNVIHLVNTTLEVADACSGIRSIISLLALAAAMAYFTQKGWLKRSVLIFLALPIAVLANAIRVIGTGILASRFGPEVAEGFFHEFAGMVIFGMAMVMLVFSATILNKMGAKRNG